MENNQSIKALMLLIQSMIDESLQGQNSITSGVIDQIHDDGSVDLHIPPDNTVFTNIPNQCPFMLEIGDNVKLIKERGRASNMWVIAKCGASNISNTGVDKAALLEYCYPVGSYYWSAENVSPQEFLGGVWESVEGEMLFAAGKHTIIKGNNYSKTIEFNPGDEGGTIYVDFSKSIDENSPSMFRDTPYTYGSPQTGSHGGRVILSPEANTTNSEVVYDGFYTSGDNSYFTAPSNMPPYRVAYCWVRTE